MNSVLISGGNKRERKIAEDVIVWCIGKLMPRMKTLDIEVEFENLKKEGAYGFCLEGDNNREFIITINRGMNLLDLVSTICHEMVHVKQYARRELRSVNGNVMWKKKVYNNVDYDNAPWEKQAFKMETNLTAQAMVSVDFNV